MRPALRKKVSDRCLAAKRSVETRKRNRLVLALLKRIGFGYMALLPALSERRIEHVLRRHVPVNGEEARAVEVVLAKPASFVAFCRRNQEWVGVELRRPFEAPEKFKGPIVADRAFT
jgi:hypothetical protein